MKNAKNAGLKCAVPKCTRDAVVIGLCKTCYSRMNYWNKRPIKHKIARIRQIEVWESSLEMQLGNVRDYKRKTG